MYFITQLKHTYILLNENSIKECIEPVLRTLFSFRQDELIDLHLSENEISIIVPTHYKKNFDTIYETEEYYALRIETDNPGRDECGILADITALFKKYEIPILSTSTYNYNYIFILTIFVENFEKLLNENTKIITFDKL